jgi:NAD(P)H dehydrogenase (quinone)
MRVLTVYAHPYPGSFCHAVLDEFTKGLRDAGHTPDVLDLYAMKFDPVFTLADMATWLHPDMPADVLERWNPRQAVLDGTPNPLKRLLARGAMGGKDNRAIARMIREHGPKDAAEHWRHVADADALAFIAPVYWLAFPAILKG